MFINRKWELSFLNRVNKSAKPEFIVIYGKRRVGKTELIKHFIEGKNSIYFLAQQVTKIENMKMLSEIMAGHFNDEMLKVTPLTNINQLFTYLKVNMNKDRLILAIDEFPYLLDADKSISSSFQYGWDEVLSHLPITLILCGSSISMMERDVLGEKSPLYGRRTGQIRVKPFTFYQGRGFSPRMNFEKQLEFYTILGGIPAYLSKFSGNLSVRKNIEINILNPSSYLYSEVEFLLRSELREPRVYFSILKAIALGKRSTGEILNDTGIEKNVLHKYLSVLEDLYIIDKVVPVTLKNPVKTRKAVYDIKDNYVRFYFRFIVPNKSMIEEGRITPVLDKIMKNLKYPVSFTFEDACREWILKNWKHFNITRIGRWWHRDTEIDLLGYDENMQNAVIAECKWTKKIIGNNILNELIDKAKNIKDLSTNCNKYYTIFSKNGFTDALKQRALKDKSITLVDTSSMK